MPARLHLTIVRSGPLLRLGLHRFCCHGAFTSWCFARFCIELCVLQIPAETHLLQSHSRWRETERICVIAHYRSSWRYCCLRLFRKRCSRERQRLNRPVSASVAPKTRIPSRTRLPLISTGVVNQLHPVAEIQSARPLLFSGDALPYVSLSPRTFLLDQILPGEDCLLGGELALPDSRVARVSRLIGNSDTTAKQKAWQVWVSGGSLFGNSKQGGDA